MWDWEAEMRDGSRVLRTGPLTDVPGFIHTELTSHLVLRTQKGLRWKTWRAWGLQVRILGA